MKNKSSKRYKKLLEASKDKKVETLEEAIKKIKNNCTAKFDESIDVSLNLNLKQKKEEVSLRTLVNLPHGNGKKIKIAVLCEESKIKEAKDSGAELSGSDNLINADNFFIHSSHGICFPSARGCAIREGL